MVLVLVVGDTWVPQRSCGVPEVFRKMFVPGRIHKILITGSVGCKEMYDYLRTIAAEVHCTASEVDRQWTESFPESAVVAVEGVKIGLIHGHQVVPVGDKDSLAALQREMDVDVLVSGGTHHSKYFEFDSRLFVNPGSLSGADDAVGADVPPSFMLLDVQDKSVVTFIYQYQPENTDDEAAHTDDGAAGTPSGLKIKKKEWVKEY
ncbi:vacuolar sorting-like protein [Leptomonas pyrrhocoris]|uniref:Vacuolar protein sorting-associated protein 29 n=1 Tax=Leptomonas pyrrhocoris TaxID=157538 RepID=A0A0M9G815_LEPPY|nr:vacuolar sorting-like protein [Leptomonas pyrrhocoris]KPA84630.1 vacuolar sorting-like protein [Leptomonas pyrrhocoris]|eukprot:XP_015663069.1 vacuolar sorting-like protein [Leptomonas pyrrhocoris]